MAEIALYAKDKRLVTDAGALLPTNARPIVRWREQDTFTLRLADGGEFTEGAYHYAFDIDRDFLETEPCNTGECEIVDGALVFTVAFDSVRQAQATNNRRHPIAFYMQVTRDGHDCAEYIIDDALWADGCVWDGRIPPAPEAPNYYTKGEVDEIAECKLDKPEEAGEEGYVLGLAEDGSTVWIPQSGGGGSQQATDAEIDARESTTHTITPNNLDYAVRSVLPNVTTIPAATTSYNLLDASATTNSHSWQYFHAPSSASTYVFPAVTDTVIAHRIKLTIDFTDTQTYSFEDSEGNALAPLFTPTVSAGDVYEFDCEYSAVKGAWLIWPHKQGAVSDDYVMQSQVGAANGVAGLGSNGKVPVPQLPQCGYGGANKGVTYVMSSLGGIAASDGGLFTAPPSKSAIDNRYETDSPPVNENCRAPITPFILNYAVTAALTDSNKIQLTDAQKASAQDTLGVGPAPLILTSAPTTSTVGVVGQLAVDTTTSKTYHCTAKTNTGTEESPVWSYTWTDDINAKGGQFGTTYYNPLIDPYRGIRMGNHWNPVGCNLVIGNSNENRGESCIVVGFNLETGTNKYVVWSGQYNYGGKGIIACVGNGTSNDARSNAFELRDDGSLKITGCYQNGIVTIPPATTAYTLCEGVQSHVPSSPSIYTLPAPQYLIAVANVLWVREPSADGEGYYAWNGIGNKRYTSSATPAVGDNTYTNTALSSGAKAITAIDRRTHEIIIDIDFSTVQTFSFEDADGNTLSLQKDITVLAGDKWRFICIYEYGMWLIYPLQLKAETVTPTTPVSITGDTATAISVQLSATASGNGILTYTATGLPAGLACSSSGLISGTPTTAGTTEATVTVKTPYSKPATIVVNFTIAQGSSTPQSLTVSGTGAQSNNFDGDYTLTNDTNNSRPVWYNSTNQKYFFAVENGMDAGWFAWVVGGSVVQQSAGDTMMFYTYCTYDVQGLSNLSESPDQSTTAWYSMGMEVSSSEFDVSVTA